MCQFKLLMVMSGILSLGICTHAMAQEYLVDIEAPASDIVFDYSKWHPSLLHTSSQARTQQHAYGAELRSAPKSLTKARTYKIERQPVPARHTKSTVKPPKDTTRR